METFSNTSRLQSCNMISTIRQRLQELKDITKSKMEEMKCKMDEETSMRRTKETLLQVSLQQLKQEKEKATALEKNMKDAVVQNIQQSAQIQKLESIKAKLQAMILEEQHLRDTAMQNVTELQIQLQKMAVKVHEVEDQLVDMESKWAVTPLVQSYSGMPHARSLSADQLLIQKYIKPYVSSHISMASAIKHRTDKQGKYSVLKHLRYFTSPKGRNKIIKSRHSTGQICSATFNNSVVSPLVASAPKDSVMTMLDFSQTSAVKAAVQKFEKLSPRVITMGAVPKRRIFQASKCHSFKQERETDPNKSNTQHNVGVTWKSHEPLPISSPSLLDTKDEAMENERSAKRCLSPTVCVSRMKKPRAEELSVRKSLLLN